MRHFKIAVIGLLALSSCRVVKTDTTKETVKVDTTKSSDSAKAFSYKEVNTYHEKKDTTIKVQERAVDATISADDLKPLYTEQGDTIEREHEFEANGVRGKAKLKKDGSLDVACICDSLQIRITGLEKIIQTTKDSTDYWRSKYDSASHYTATNSVTNTETTRNRFTWQIGLLLAAVIAVIWWFETRRKK